MAESRGLDSSSKLLKTASIDDDRLSSLYDSLLIHIMSFLPTVTSIFTVSRLSHRYRNLWRELQVFNFDYHHHYAIDDPELMKNFAAFVNDVLVRKKSPDIRKMHLCLPYTLFDRLYTSCINTWIDAAIGPYLENLHLSLISNSNNDLFCLPLNLFTTCTNLVSLSLCQGIFVPLEHSTVVQFPALKKLHFDISYYADEEDFISLHVLLSGCPKLEVLYLSFPSQTLHNIHLPRSLKTLEFTIENNIGACLEILDAPGLKKLTLSQITFSNIGDLHNVLEANLDVFSPPTQSIYDKSLLKLLQALPEIKHLFLGLSTTKWLLGAPVLDFPTFGNLRNLRIILPCFNSNFLFTVLNNCHKLQTLIIQNCKEPNPNTKQIQKPKRRMPQLRSVHNCLVSHLTYIYFKGFQGLEDEMAFAEYILQKGLVLENVIIGDAFGNLWEMDHDLKKLSDKPRGSTKCKLRFESLDGIAAEFPIDCS